MAHKPHRERANGLRDPAGEIEPWNRESQPEPFVDAEEAGAFLRLPRRRVLQLARRGKIPAYPIGDGRRKIWRFRLSELAAAMLHSRQRSHVPEEI
jgi:Helix-turn-helix domain